jgi:predicted dehydrogenase
MPDRIVVIGLGSIGLRHARNLVSLGCAVTGFDPDPARRAAVEPLGIAAAATLEAAFDGARAAIVASPSAHHAAHLEAALAADLHVFVEKPIAHARADLDAALARADSCGRVVFAGLMLRYHPAVERARALLMAGDLGQPIWARALCASWLPGWRPSQDYRKGYAADPATGGVIFDVIHEFDLAIHLLGPARTVACAAIRSGRLEMPSEDVADILLRHDGGAQTSLHLDYLTRPAQRTTEIAGDAGIVRLDLNGRRLTRWTIDGTLAEERVFNGSYADDYLAEMRHFLACIVGEARPRCDGHEALRVLDQVLEARKLGGLPT